MRKVSLRDAQVDPLSSKPCAVIERRLLLSSRRSIGSNPAFHLIWWVYLFPLITRGIFIFFFSLFITDSFSDQSDSSTSAPGGYSGDNEQSGNHVSTLWKILPKEAERFHFIFDKWREKCLIEMTLKKVESVLHLSSWDCGNIPFQIMYIRLITDNPKHLSKGEYSSRFLDNIIIEHGVSNSLSTLLNTPPLTRDTNDITIIYYS